MKVGALLTELEVGEEEESSQVAEVPDHSPNMAEVSVPLPFASVRF